MKAKITNMTEGSPSKLIITFALPLMVGNIFQQLYTVIDTMVVGRALGVSALAALGATDWLMGLIIIVSIQRKNYLITMGLDLIFQVSFLI